VAVRVERQKKAGAKRGEEKRKGWWLKRESPNRKVHWDQRGLGPRLRVARRVVGAKARFWAQRTIPRYTTFQTMMNTIFHNLIDKGNITIYMDDIAIHTRWLANPSYSSLTSTKHFTYKWTH